MSDRISVVFVTTTFNQEIGSGPELYARNIWDFFGEHPGIEMHMVCLTSDIDHPRVHVVESVPTGPGVRAYAAVEEKLKEVLGEFPSAPIVHVNSAHIISADLVDSTNAMIQINDTEVACWRPDLVTLRTYGLRRFLAIGWRRIRERGAVKCASRVVCNSEYTAATIRSAYGRDDAQVIYKAADLSGFWSVAGKREMSSTSPIRLCFLGSNWKIKGLDILFAALRRLQSEAGDSYRLAIYGGDFVRDAEELNRQVAAMDLAKSATYHGRLKREEVPAALGDADIFVMPSRSEALGVSAIEALATGMPVVATNVGGLPEVVSDPRCGMLVLPEDPVRLADAIRSTALTRLKDPEETQWRARSVEKFHTERLYQELVELYQECSRA